MKTTIALRKLSALAISICACVTICSAQTPPPVRILPFGDSITEGCCSGTIVEGGYRTRLQTLLEAEGFNVDFVGSLTDENPPSPDADSDHEGHAGSLIEDLESGIGTWLEEIEDPDVILLHAGTINFWINRTVEDTQDRLRSLLAEISVLRPYARIVVASLIPRSDSYEAVQMSYNDSLPGIVAEQVALGRKVSFCDIHGAAGSEFLVAGDLADGVHPTLAGYDKMADRWLLGITGIITPLGTSDPPAVVEVNAGADRQHAWVRFSKPVRDEDAVAANFQISGGLTVLGAALDASSKRIVTLQTSMQEPSSAYTVSVSGVHDLTPEANLVAAGPGGTFNTPATWPVQLVNGGFEQGSPADFGSLDGWTVTADTGSEPVGFTHTEPGSGPLYMPNEGLRIAMFNNGSANFTGAISQSFATTPGAAYAVELDLGIVADDVGRSQAMGIVVAGAAAVPHVEVVETVNSTGPTSFWAARKSYQFIADSLMTTLTLSDASGALTVDQRTNSDLLLDDVRVSEVIIENSPPVADDATAAVAVGGAVDVTLSASDADTGDTLTFAIATGPANGTLTLLGAVATYTPNPGFSGLDGFTFTANDGTVDSAEATIQISVTAPSDGFLVNGGFEFGSPRDFGSLDGWTVTGDLGSEPLGFTSTEPGFVPPFTPNEGLRMAVLNNGAANNTGAVSQSFATTVGATYAVELDMGIVADHAGRSQMLEVVIAGTEGEPLIDALETISSTGALTFWAERKSYEFVANSLTTTLTLLDASGMLTPSQRLNSDLLLDDVRVTELYGGNIAPVADAQSVTVAQGGTLDITLTASDADMEDMLTFAIATGPANGTVNLVGAVATYTPDTSFTGLDGFTFTANDGTLDSPEATIRIFVAAPSDGFLINGGFEQGNPLDFGTLDGWTVTAEPDNEPIGLSSTEPGYVPSFTPNEGFRMAVFNNGGTNFTGAISQSFATTPGVSYAVELDMGIVADGAGRSQMLEVVIAGTEGEPLVDALETISSTGALTFWAERKSYEFIADSLTTTLTLLDASGMLTSSQWMNSDLLLDDVRVTELYGGNIAPVAVDDGSMESPILTVEQNSGPSAPIAVLLNDSDVDEDPLTVETASSPGGEVTIHPDGTLTFTPSVNFSGPTTITYSIGDGQGGGASATAYIMVIPLPGFGTWLGGYGLVAGPREDSDGDSISNAVEYVIGGNPANHPDAALLPTVELQAADLDGNPGDEEYLLFTYRRSDLANADPSTTITVEWSGDFTDPWMVADGAHGEVIQVEDGEGIDRVKVYLPCALGNNGKLFARLAVSVSLP